MKKKLNILHFPEWYPHDEDDMEGIFVQQHVEAINSLHNCCVLFCKPKEQRALIRTVLEEEKGYLVIRIFYKQCISGFEPINKLLRKVLYFLAVRKGFREVKKMNFKEDMLHLHVAGKNSRYVQAFYSKPFVISEHWSKYLQKNQQYDTSLIKKAKGITAVSKDLLDNLFKRDDSELITQVIPNVVGEDTFYYRDDAENRNKKTLLHVSEFNEESKNIKGILTAFRELLHIRKDVELLLVGYGKDKEMLIEEVSTLGISDHVRFKGKLYPDAIAKLMSEASLFVFNSRYETFGIVIIEALLCGCPVVSTPVGIAKELIHDKNGLLVDDNMSESLNIALDKEFDRKAIAAEFVGMYNEAHVSSSFNRFYNNALNK